MENIEDRLKPSTDLSLIAQEIFDQYLEAIAKKDFRVAKHSVKSFGAIVDQLKDRIDVHEFIKPYIYEGKIQVERCSFCFTGEFVLADRESLEEAVKASGGKLASKITSSSDYLVLGSAIDFGRKIEDAVEYKLLGYPIMLVKESHFIEQMGLK